MSRTLRFLLVFCIALGMFPAQASAQGREVYLPLVQQEEELLASVAGGQMPAEDFEVEVHSRLEEFEAVFGPPVIQEWVGAFNKKDKGPYSVGTKVIWYVALNGVGCRDEEPAQGIDIIVDGVHIDASIPNAECSWFSGVFEDQVIGVEITLSSFDNGEDEESINDSFVAAFELPPEETPTPTVTVTPTPTATTTPTVTLTLTPTVTPTVTPTPTVTLTPTVTVTPTVTLTPTVTVTPTPTVTVTPVPTITVTPTPTRTPKTTLPPTPVFSGGRWYFAWLGETTPTPTPIVTPVPTPTKSLWYMVDCMEDPVCTVREFSADTVPAWVSKRPTSDLWSASWEGDRWHNALSVFGQKVDYYVDQFFNGTIIKRLRINGQEFTDHDFSRVEVKHFDFGRIQVFVLAETCYDEGETTRCLRVQTWWRQSDTATGKLQDATRGIYAH